MGWVLRGLVFGLEGEWGIGYSMTFLVEEFGVVLLVIP